VLGRRSDVAATDGTFFGAAWLAVGQEIVDVAALEEFDFDFEVLGQALPAAAGL